MSIQCITLKYWTRKGQQAFMSAETCLTWVVQTPNCIFRWRFRCYTEYKIRCIQSIILGAFGPNEDTHNANSRLKIKHCLKSQASLCCNDQSPTWIRIGILIQIGPSKTPNLNSVICWILFDNMSTFCFMYRNFYNEKRLCLLNIWNAWQ